jgi:hypothetical protein
VGFAHHPAHPASFVSVFLMPDDPIKLDYQRARRGRGPKRWWGNPWIQMAIWLVGFLVVGLLILFLLGRFAI